MSQDDHLSSHIVHRRPKLGITRLLAQYRNQGFTPAKSEAAPNNSDAQRFSRALNLLHEQDVPHCGIEAPQVQDIEVELADR